MNFKEAPHSFGRSSHFEKTNRRDQFVRRPRAEEVSVAMSDSETTPQVAVGGMKEVEELSLRNLSFFLTPNFIRSRNKIILVIVLPPSFNYCYQLSPFT